MGPTKQPAAAALNWKPDTELPQSLPITALIAVCDDEGNWFLLDGIWTMTNATGGRWMREEDNVYEMAADGFLWLAESELTDTIPSGRRGNFMLDRGRCGDVPIKGAR